MKAIHGGKEKNDKINSQKIAALLRSEMLLMAYVYPQAMRSTRDLLRRRLYLVRQPACSFAAMNWPNITTCVWCRPVIAPVSSTQAGYGRRNNGGSSGCSAMKQIFRGTFVP